MSAAQQKSQSYPAIELRLASVADIDALVLLFATFFRESHYQPHLQFDPAICAKYLRAAIGSGFSPHIIALDEDKIVGVISYHFDSSFSATPLAVMDEVYALEEYRGTPVGRALVAAMLDLIKSDGGTCIHIPLTSGHKAMPSLVNLFKKFGAEEIGVVMRKVL
jgi:GNAT superfamily N-acetyltransferase